jgi:hypothetical protein
MDVWKVGWVFGWMFGWLDGCLVGRWVNNIDAKFCKFDARNYLMQNSANLMQVSIYPIK